MFGRNKKDDTGWSKKSINTAYTQVCQRLAALEKGRVDTSEFGAVLNSFFPRCGVCGIRRRIEDVRFRSATMNFNWTPESGCLPASNMNPAGVICDECYAALISTEGQKKKKKKAEKK